MKRQASISDCFKKRMSIGKHKKDNKNRKY